MKRRTLVSFDWAAKDLLRQKANFDILEGFLSETLYEDIKVKSILESESNKIDAADKYNQVDIICENSKDELIFIEIQFYDDIDYFHRLNYAVSKVVTEHMYEGYEYDRVKKVYSINILYFDLGIGEDYIYHGKMEFIGHHKKDVLALSLAQQAKFKRQFPSAIFPEIIIFKIKNYDDQIQAPLDQWIYFFKHTDLPDRYDAKGLHQVERKLNLDKMDTSTQNNYIDYLKNVRVNEHAIESARQESEQIGISKGRVEGRVEGKIEVVLALHEDNIPINLIAKYANLTEREIIEILRQHGRIV